MNQLTITSAQLAVGIDAKHTLSMGATSSFCTHTHHAILHIHTYALSTYAAHTHTHTPLSIWPTFSQCSLQCVAAVVAVVCRAAGAPQRLYACTCYTIEWRAVLVKDVEYCIATIALHLCSSDAIDMSTHKLTLARARAAADLTHITHTLASRVS